jgi:hypothetical protein
MTEALTYRSTLFVEGKFDYFCCNCLQLIAADGITLDECENCGNSMKNCVIGGNGSLNRELLLKSYGKGGPQS